MASSAFNLGVGYIRRISDIVLSIFTTSTGDTTASICIVVAYHKALAPSNIGGLGAMGLSQYVQWAAGHGRKLNLVALPNTDINSDSVLKLSYGDSGYAYYLYANKPLSANVNGTQKTFSAGNLILSWAYNSIVNHTISDIKLL